MPVWPSTARTSPLISPRLSYSHPLASPDYQAHTAKSNGIAETKKKPEIIKVLRRAEDASLGGTDRDRSEIGDTTHQFSEMRRIRVKLCSSISRDGSWAVLRGNLWLMEKENEGCLFGRKWGWKFDVARSAHLTWVRRRDARDQTPFHVNHLMWDGSEA